MIARIAPEATPGTQYQQFLDALVAVGFRGEIDAGYATRTVLATNNSIYQRLRQAAVFPRDTADVQCLARLAGDPAYR